MAKTLFDKVNMGTVALANRVAMAPLTRNRAPDGVPTAMMATYYQQRATAGLLISEGTSITQEGQGYSDVPGLYTAQQVQGWKQVTAAVHQAGGHIVTQLWHVGRVSHTALQKDGQAPVAPSAIQAKSRVYVINADGTGGFLETSMPRALLAEELPRVCDDYRHAMKAAVEAGFDGVEIHAANGYLLDQFLRSGANHRTDAYGGSVENRARFPLEVVAATIEAAAGHPVGIRISPAAPANGLEDPNPQEVFDYFVAQLARFPLAFVHVIEGATGGPRDYQMGDKPFDYVQLKAAYTKAGGKGLWMVNNGYDRASAQKAVESGYADMVSFGRAYIANPDLVRRLRDGSPLNTPDQTTFYGGGEKGYIDYPALP